MPTRFQYRLSTLLWITLAVACWFGGMRFERWRAEPEEVFYWGIATTLDKRIRRAIPDE
ncbi:MAG TPA: hypothetical protein VND64_21135 [Pirellulales bacterium]|nr:hypothetical protein [Pirellulales bacterium]